MTDIDIGALIADLRQPGGDERELSDRVALALGWTSDHINGTPAIFWSDPDRREWHTNPPLFSDDISALLRTLPEDQVWMCGAPESGPFACVYEEKSDDAVDLEDAPTAARALCIARLMLRERTGR